MSIIAKENLSSGLVTFDLEESTKRILAGEKLTAYAIVSTGIELIWVRINIHFGEWYPYLENKLNRSPSWATNFMRWTNLFAGWAKIGKLDKEHPENVIKLRENLTSNQQLTVGFNIDNFWGNKPKQLKELEWLRVGNHWFFVECDKTLGIQEWPPGSGKTYPGRIPGQIAKNVLYYYTKEGDLVVDPMAGGGSTIDACKRLNRQCLAYDINIVREDIKYNDIRQGFPKEAENCDLIFLDPPYHKLLENEYITSSVSSLELDDFLRFLSQLAIDCYKTVKSEGFVSFLCQNFYHKFASLNNGYTNFGIEAYKRFTDAGFELVNEINCPQTSQVYSASDVELAKKQKGMLNLVRDLFIFRK